ncbi:MAG: hypothetical protein EOO39_00435 [Cytophagaceae bacterium]|nr:MAG: hypothetical protein EOO39_00435 [Cytophagaceae bacterium]
MGNLLDAIKDRNEPLYIFGLICFCIALVCIGLIRLTNVQVLGVNAWYKPLKFALSIGLFTWTMAWYCSYLNAPKTIYWYNWVVIGLLGFELLYIIVQAGRGQLSHFNISSPLYAALYSAMAAAITIVVLWTAYIGLLFFQTNFPDLPDYYVWGIRLGILLFVIFAFEGFAMGGRLTHTVGGPDGGPGLPLLNWSRLFGDLRIAHFVGMHALQVVPILSWYLLKNTKATILLALFYGFVAVWLLVQAFQSKPLVR